MGYKIILDAYEGPLDLLLSLIEKAEIDIYDIPINIITKQFLEYLSEMEGLSLIISSEFLYMAATLIEIKSKMLLPQEVIIDDGIEFELDPRDDLVRRLIEYKQYKEAAEVLKVSELIESQVYYKPREDLSIYNDPIEELGNLNLDQLVKVINNIIARNIIQEKLLEISEIHREEYTLEDCIDEIEIMLLKSNKFKFSALLNIKTSKEEIITYFLSLLELIKLKSVFVYQDGVFTDLVIEKRMSEASHGQ